VKDVVKNAIEKGEGSNFTIARKLSGKIENFNYKQMVNLFRKMIENECGAYQTFCLFTGKFFIVGASPECHINVENKRVRMQPISGTYRKNNNISIDENKELLNEFLNDKKEINELFMTVDEELKMMAKICPKGGSIIGPRIREMSKVLHTEYLLTGMSEMPICQVIKESMHAATVVGSPIESAFKVGEKYNNFDRKYYGGILGVLNQKECFFDSSIIIRSIYVENETGNFEICAGASIVKDSNPENELLEVNAKLNSLLENLKSSKIQKPKQIMQYLQNDHKIVESLHSRNQNLSHFLFFDKANERNLDEKLIGKKVLIINNEDDFTNMLYHILSKLGINAKIVSYKEIDKENFNNFDAVLIGPGPGDPNNELDEKISKLHNIVNKLIQEKKKIIGVCLGHQIILKCLGFDIKKGEKILQGEAVKINLFEREEVVSFYNTFFAMYDEKLTQKHNIKVSYDKHSKNIYATRGAFLTTMQFHPESILTQNGVDIIKEELLRLFL
jgi:phenazine biosynthesis protein phzE